MDEDFPSEPLKTPCMSDTVTAEDFPQLQTSVTSSSEYDLQVFSPSFDTSGNTFSNPVTSLKTGSSQNYGKGFLVDDNMMDLQLYESLQNHHNYSLKPAEPVSVLIPKQENTRVGDFGVVSNLTGHLPDADGNLGTNEDSDDPSLDISDPLKEICRSSSPLFVPSQTKETCPTDSSHSAYSHITDGKSGENNADLKDSLFKKESKTDTVITDSLSELQPEKKESEQSVTNGSKNSKDLSEGSRDKEVAATNNSTNSTESLEAIEDKTMFSENLGLIPADSGIKTLAEKKQTVRKGVRTRKSFELAALSQVNDGDPIRGHKHSPGLYRCGSCNKTFVTICKLHTHLQDHSSGGSYHYNHILKTAFPKFDTVCAYTQTAEKEHRFTPKISPFGRGIKLKPKDKSPVADESVVTKRKRGRPRKLIESESQSAEVKEKQKIICKLKVKTDDGGNTWKEVRDIPKGAKKRKEKHPLVAVIDRIVSDKEEEEETSKNVDSHLNQLETDTNILTEKESEIGIIDKKETDACAKNSRKRKMSVPRKLLHVSGSDGKKIVNSRSKPVFKIKCDFCPCEFQYTRGLIRHEQEKHADEMKFECALCDQKFMRSYNLERHKLCSHTTGKSRLLRQKKGISMWREKKKRGRKPLDRSPENSITCEVCGTSLPESKAEIHLRIHSGERPFICHVCGKGLISDKKLKRHLLIHSETKRHTCEVCGEGFAMKNKLRTHMFQHTGHKPYLCSVCAAEFNNSTSLLHHHRTVHLGDKRFECTICGGRYGKKSQLEEHMFSHSSERTQTCRFCGKTFKHAKSLRRHEFTHVSDQKFSCDQCDSKFSRKDNLERHKMCHLETSQQCRFCKKKFRDRRPLLDHEQFHINQRKYQCLVCKDKFQEETYFYSHMEKVHELPRKTVDAMIESREMKESMEMAAKDLSSHGMIMDSPADQLDHQGAITIDTLNFSMNLAGIIPSSGQDLIPGTTSAPLQVATTVNNVVNQSLDSSQNIIITNGTQIINHPGTTGFATTSRIIPGVHNGQRTTFATISTTDNSSLRLPINQPSGTITLTSDSIIVHEQQQRLMQEALGSSLNMQNTGFRMQNLY